MKTGKTVLALFIFLTLVALSSATAPLAQALTVTDLSQANAELRRFEDLKNSPSYSKLSTLERSSIQIQIQNLTAIRDVIKQQLAGLKPQQPKYQPWTGYMTPAKTNVLSTQNGAVIGYADNKDPVVVRGEQGTYYLNQGTYYLIEYKLTAGGTKSGFVPKAAVSIIKPATATTSTTTAAIPQAEKAIAWAKSVMALPQAKKEKYSGWCLIFVANAYNQFGVNLCVGKCETAKQLADSRKRYNVGVPSVIPPRGALVFFNYIAGGKNLGHVGISLGDGTFIHATSGNSNVVIISKLNGYTSNSNYLGWCYPSNKS